MCRSIAQGGRRCPSSQRRAARAADRPSQPAVVAAGADVATIDGDPPAADGLQAPAAPAHAPTGQPPQWRQRLLALQQAAAIDRWARVAELERAGRGGETITAAFDQGLMTIEGGPGRVALEQERLVRAAGRVVDNQVQRRVDRMLAGQPRPAEARAERDRAIRELDEIDQGMRDTQAAIERLQDRVLAERFEGRLSKELSDREWAQFQALVSADPAYPSEGHQFLKRRRAVVDRRVALSRELRAAEQRETAAQRAALLAVLSEHRPMGAATPEAPWRFVDRPGRAGDPDVQALLEKGAQFWPRTWIQASNRRGPIHAERATRGYHRGHDDGSCDLAISASGSSRHAGDAAELPVVLHEQAHRMEAVRPAVAAMQWTHYQQRTALPPGDPSHSQQSTPVPLTELIRGSAYRPDEVTRQDRFADPYMGKDYGNLPFAHYELLSMGSESVWTGSSQLDAEHRRLVLGLLALG
jgi:hypothetical protein